MRVNLVEKKTKNVFIISFLEQAHPLVVESLFVSLLEFITFNIEC